MPDFLLEIGCEEIPARMIDAAEDELLRRVHGLLSDNRILVGQVATQSGLSTPRRLAVSVHGVRAEQSGTTEKVVGPPREIAFKDGKPTKAAEAFAKKAGLSSELGKAESTNLKVESTPRGDYLVGYQRVLGRRSVEILAELLPKEIASIYWPKTMYWRSNAPERFVRPIRWIVAMLDGEVIPLEFAGVKAGKTSRGHRFFASEVKIKAAKNYEEALASAHVLVSRSEREQKIRKALDAATRAVPGARWREDRALLDTVVNLTEWPSVILGSFDKEFLELPEEVLVTVMRDHQKYFAVEDAHGKLAPHFLAVLNTDGDPDGLIRHGNERVLRARFNDARFFWQTDQKVPLKQRIERLRAVTFQKDLGSYYEKTERVQKLAKKLGEDLNDAGTAVNVEALSEAAWLAKTDLTTELVKEFTELQGVVGGLYARAQGHGENVSRAIYDQYKPESAEDNPPKTIDGAVLSIADKADTIAGMFALGLQPTGSKDPFALRRQANGIVATIAHHRMGVPLAHILRDALSGYRGTAVEKKFKAQDETQKALIAFFRERLEFYLRDVKGFAYDEVNAVLAAGADDVSDAAARAEAVHSIRNSEFFEPISIAFKRIANILKQAREKGFDIPERPEITDTEIMPLRAAVKMFATDFRLSKEARNYSAALELLAVIRPPIDDFFDKVMVMVSDESLRSQRLALLSELVTNFSTIADFSEIVTEGKTN
jgi:glycyl-tRNA synthetase beta chain